MKHVWSPSLAHVHMKTRRAEVHLKALEDALRKWLDDTPYTLDEQDNLEKGWHYYVIRVNPVPEDIPMLVGDLVCCLRSALDQLAWNLTHLDSARVFTATEQRRIHFLIFPVDDSTYRDRRKLFPATVADVIDTFQPYLRGNAYRDDPLWQLNELWTLDKHRTIPTNCQNIKITFPVEIHWERESREIDDGVVVRLPPQRCLDKSNTHQTKRRG